MRRLLVCFVLSCGVPPSPTLVDGLGPVTVAPPLELTVVQLPPPLLTLQVPDSGMPDAGPTYTACTTPLLHSLQVDSRCDCSVAVQDVALAISTLWDFGIFEASPKPGDGGFDQFYGIFKQVDVRVLYDPMDRLGGAYYAGAYYEEISSSMDGMAHEGIHMIEYWEGVIDPNDPHKGWSTNQTYIDAMSYYVFYHYRVPCQ